MFCDIHYCSLLLYILELIDAIDGQTHSRVRCSDAVTLLRRMVASVLVGYSAVSVAEQVPTFRRSAVPLSSASGSPRMHYV